MGLVKKILFSLLLLTTLGFSQWDGVEYTINEPSIIFAWDESEGATKYKVRLVWIDPTNEFIYDLGEVLTTEMTIPRPRAGHFRLEVAACNETECSEYATSITHGQVDGEAKGWKIFWRIPPPTGPVID